MTTARDRPPEEAAEDTSFARGLRLLLTVADRGEVRADELGATLDMPLSTVYRYLRTLGEFGFVDRHGGHVPARPEAAHRDRRQRQQRAAHPPRRRGAADARPTRPARRPIVVRRIGLASVCLHQIESDAPLRVTVEPGDMSPLYAGAPGRVLLAFAPTEVLDEVLAQDLVRITDAHADRGRAARQRSAGSS